MTGALKSFDLPIGLYADDVQSIAESGIGRYGAREWRLVVLTNEIHGHLGIYSTLGAKMGLRALEEFEAAGIDTHHMSVLSFAGSVPPVSCLNDGLQISTGATVGHGLIDISDDPYVRAEAEFRSGGNALRLRLKPEYEEQIRRHISTGVDKFGHGPQYWQYVRELAISYWRDWDRKEIYLSTWVNTGV